jgi:hypothetical protein
LSVRETQRSRTQDASAVSRGSWRHWREVLIVLALSISGIGLLLLATPHGNGVSADSMQYISAAEYLSQGDGLRAHWWDEGAQPLTHFPPGFPLALALLGRLGLSALDAARTLNIVALVATVFLTFGLTRKATGGSAFAGIAGAGVMVFARDILEAHAMVWSEPLFLAMVLGTVYLTVVAIETGKRAPLVTAAILAGLAGLARYAVPPLIVTCALALLFFGVGQWRHRLARATMFGVIAALPLAAVIAFNSTRAVAATNRELAFHPPGWSELDNAARTAYNWVVPGAAPALVETLVVTAIAVAALAWIVSLLRSRSWPRVAAPDVRIILSFFAVCYTLFLAAILTVVDAQSTPDFRLLLPVLPVLTILAVCILADSLKIERQRRPAMALSATLAFGLVLSTAFWLSNVRQRGLGYNATDWQRSLLIARLRNLDAQTLIYTNHPAAVLFHTGREVLGVPRMANPNSLSTESAFTARMSAVCAAAGERRVVYAHFNRDTEWYLPSLSDIRTRWHSQPTLVAPDGVLDVVPRTCATTNVAGGTVQLDGPHRQPDK